MHFIKAYVTRIEDNLDPCEFSCRKNKSTEDATLLFNSLVGEHRENNNSMSGHCLYTSTLELSTLKLDIVINKFRYLDVSPIFCTFIPDLFNKSRKKERLNDIMSRVLAINLKVVYSLLYCLCYTQTNYDHGSGIVI